MASVPTIPELEQQLAKLNKATERNEALIVVKHIAEHLNKWLPDPERLSMPCVFSVLMSHTNITFEVESADGEKARRRVEIN